MKIETPYPLKKTNMKTENPQVYPIRRNSSIFDNDELGITLRDHFAGLAMSSLQGLFYPKEKSKKAYEIADAMLEERMKINANQKNN